MKISDEALDEFIRIYKKKFKKKLSRAEAEEMARNVVTLYECLANKMPNEKSGA